jgi:hypothetical protein
MVEMIVANSEKSMLLGNMLCANALNPILVAVFLELFNLYTADWYAICIIGRYCFGQIVNSYPC